MLKNQNQKMHCAHAQIFSTERSQQGMPLKFIKRNSWIFWFDQNMENDVNSQELLCNKISGNPRFFFYNFLRHSLLTALHGEKF